MSVFVNFIIPKSVIVEPNKETIIGFTKFAAGPIELITAIIPPIIPAPSCLNGAARISPILAIGITTSVPCNMTRYPSLGPDAIPPVDIPGVSSFFLSPSLPLKKRSYIAPPAHSPASPPITAPISVPAPGTIEPITPPRPPSNVAPIALNAALPGGSPMASSRPNAITGPINGNLLTNPTALLSNILPKARAPFVNALPNNLIKNLFKVLPSATLNAFPASFNAAPRPFFKAPSPSLNIDLNIFTNLPKTLLTLPRSFTILNGFNNHLNIKKPPTSLKKPPILSSILSPPTSSANPLSRLSTAVVIHQSKNLNTP